MLDRYIEIIAIYRRYRYYSIDLKKNDVDPSLARTAWNTSIWEEPVQKQLALQGRERGWNTSALEGAFELNTLYKSTFYLLTYLNRRH